MPGKKNGPHGVVIGVGWRGRWRWQVRERLAIWRGLSRWNFWRLCVLVGHRIPLAGRGDSYFQNGLVSVWILLTCRCRCEFGLASSPHKRGFCLEGSSPGRLPLTLIVKDGVIYYLSHNQGIDSHSMCRERVRPKSPHYSWLIKPFSGGDHPEASMLFFPYQLFLGAQLDLDLGFWCKRSALKPSPQSLFVAVIDSRKGATLLIDSSDFPRHCPWCVIIIGAFDTPRGKLLSSRNDTSICVLVGFGSLGEWTSTQTEILSTVLAVLGINDADAVRYCCHHFQFAAVVPLPFRCPFVRLDPVLLAESPSGYSIEHDDPFTSVAFTSCSLSVARRRQSPQATLEAPKAAHARSYGAHTVDPRIPNPRRKHHGPGGLRLWRLGA